jgi:hypothetical protein
VIEQANYLIDLHAGDGNEALRPYVYMPVTGNAELDAASRGLAVAFGLDHIVIDEGRVMPPEASLYTDQTAYYGYSSHNHETGQLGSMMLTGWTAVTELRMSCATCACWKARKANGRGLVDRMRSYAARTGIFARLCVLRNSRERIAGCWWIRLVS